MGYDEHKYKKNKASGITVTTFLSMELRILRFDKASHKKIY